jgi:hypothetical protein
MTIETKETAVAGGPADFLEVRHVVLRGTNREIGRAIAEIARNEFDVQLQPAPDPVVLGALREYLQGHYPIHYQKMLGVADAYGITADDPRFDSSGLAYLFELPGCSTAFIPPAKSQNGHSLISRNFDFSLGTASQMAGMPPRPGELPMVSRPCVFEVYPDEGYASVYLCVYDLLGTVDGINSEGLTVVLQADDESMAKYPVPPTLRPSVGLHEPLMLRSLLDTCATAEEAKRALLLTKQPRQVVPAHYIIGDRFGNSFVWESSPLYNRDYITDGGGDIQIATNYLLYPGPRPVPDPSDDPGWTFRRYKMLSEAILTGNGGVSGVSGATIEDLKTRHACVNFCAAFDRKMSAEAGIESGEAITSPGDADGPRDLGRTVWHSVYDLEERRFEVKFNLGESADGQNRFSEYQQFRLEP